LVQNKLRVKKKRYVGHVPRYLHWCNLISGIHSLA